MRSLRNINETNLRKTAKIARIIKQTGMPMLKLNVLIGFCIPLGKVSPKDSNSFLVNASRAYLIGERY
jgi:hypothetical protein